MLGDFGIRFYVEDPSARFLRDLILMAFGTITLGSMFCLVYAWLEQVFPNVLIPRTDVTYEEKFDGFASKLIGSGLVGMGAILVWWAISRAPLPSGILLFLIASAIVYDVGAILFFRSERQKPRPGSSTA